MGRPYNNFSLQKFPIKKKFTEAKFCQQKIFEEILKKHKIFSGLKKIYIKISARYFQQIL